MHAGVHHVCLTVDLGRFEAYGRRALCHRSVKVKISFGWLRCPSRHPRLPSQVFRAARAHLARALSLDQFTTAISSYFDLHGFFCRLCCLHAVSAITTATSASEMDFSSANTPATYTGKAWASSCNFIGLEVFSGQHRQNTGIFECFLPLWDSFDPGVASCERGQYPLKTMFGN